MGFPLLGNEWLATARAEAWSALVPPVPLVGGECDVHIAWGPTVRTAGREDLAVRRDADPVDVERALVGEVADEAGVVCLDVLLDRSPRGSVVGLLHAVPRARVVLQHSIDLPHLLGVRVPI